jgi:hypothetical protein
MPVLEDLLPDLSKEERYDKKKTQGLDITQSAGITGGRQDWLDSPGPSQTPERSVSVRETESR